MCIYTCIDIISYIVHTYIQYSLVTLKESLGMSYKVKFITWPSHPTYPRERQYNVHTTTCTQLFIVSLLTITPNWKYPNVSISWWMNKQTAISVQWKILSNKKEWATDTYARTQWITKCTVLSNRGQDQRATYCMILWHLENTTDLLWHSGKGKIIGTNQWLSGARG